MATGLRWPLALQGATRARCRPALDPQVGAQRFVDLSAPAWVDAQVQSDYAIKKLSSYLEQPQLSLRQMLLTFGEAFLGE